MGGVDWVHLAQDRNKCRDLTNSIVNFRVNSNAGKFSSDCTTDGFSISAQILS
jgi:hypothetical protein